MSAARPFEVRRFVLEGRPAFVIRPPGAPRPGGPWVWYAPTLPGLPSGEEDWMFARFLARGVAIAGVDVGESYGSPAGCALFSRFHAHAVAGLGLSSRVRLLGRSRGGLMHVNWAAGNAHLVERIAGIYPVCNLASYPGLATACGAYGMTEAELSASLPAFNPVDRLAPLASAGVPVLLLHGDRDTVVPLEANSGLFAERYRALGGPVRLILVPGGGHDHLPHWFQCAELADFLSG
jgi:dipeptidyl aminopeptidase/acylaminoacyl peptidase